MWPQLKARQSLWPIQLRSVFHLTVWAQASPDSLFIPREHAAMGWGLVSPEPDSNWCWRQLPDFHHLPSESVHHHHFICLPAAPSEFQNWFWQLLFLTSRRCLGSPRCVWQFDVSLHNQGRFRARASLWALGTFERTWVSLPYSLAGPGAPGWGEKWGSLIFFI